MNRSMKQQWDKLGRGVTALILAWVMGNLPLGAGATIVNMDFNGRDVGDPAPPTFSGVGAAGGGTLWNGVLVDSSSGNFNLTVTATSLTSDTGGATGLGFTIAPVAGDNNTVIAPDALLQDYLFINYPPAGNSATTAPFTISGFGGATTANLYFYKHSSAVFTGVGGTGSTYPWTSPPYFVHQFLNVPVIADTITGSLGSPSLSPGDFQILYGLTVEFTLPVVPEPGTLLLMACGGGLLWRRRRHPFAE